MRSILAILLFALHGGRCAMLLAARSSILRARRMPTAADYVQDGLVALYDAIENVGWKTHSNSATRWVNLAGGSGYGDLTVGANGSWRERAFIFSGTAAAMSSDTWSPQLTHEACLRFDRGYAPIMFPSVYRVWWGFESGFAGMFVAATVRHPTSTGAQVSSVQRWNTGTRYKIPVTLCAVYESNSSRTVAAIYANGEACAQNGTSSQNTDKGTRFCIGGRYGVTSNYNSSVGECYCVRLYSRQLTAAEVAANHVIDKARFNLPS